MEIRKLHMSSGMCAQPGFPPFSPPPLWTLPNHSLSLQKIFSLSGYLNSEGMCAKTATEGSFGILVIKLTLS